MKEKLLYNYFIQVLSKERLLGDMAHLFDLLGAKVGNISKTFAWLFCIVQIQAHLLGT